MESAVLGAEEELQLLQSHMNDPAILADRHKLTELCEKVDAAQQKVHVLYERWQDLEARREANAQ